MEPLKLILENFCGHNYTEIDFTKFSSAIVLGSIKDNPKLSNGAGKSTIFLAIEYVLFNETRFSSLDKLIMDNSDSCKVAFEFKLKDNIIYKVIRSRDKKVGSDLRLYKKNEDLWEDITQRRNSDSEKEIFKLIKINYKTFISTVLFSQSKSETNTQMEYSDIASITPEKRKSILKEILQLNSYSKYDQQTKKIILDLSKEIEKNKTILEMLGDPIKDIKNIDVEITGVKSKIVHQTDKLEDLKATNLYLSNEINEKKTVLSLKENSVSNILDRQKRILSDLERLNFNLNESRKRYTSTSKELENIEKNINSFSDKLTVLKKSYSSESIESFSKELQSLEKDKLEKQINNRNLLLEIEKLTDISTDLFCSKCKQTVSPNHINDHIEENKKSKNKFSNKISKNIDLIKIIDSNMLVVKQNLFKISEIENNILNLEKNIHKLFSDKEVKNNILQQIEVAARKEKEEIRLKEEENKSVSIDNSIEKSILDLKNELNKLNYNHSLSTSSVNSSSLELKDLELKLSIMSHQKSQFEDSLNKSKDIKHSLIDQSKNLELHYKVSSAFGSSGIPALVIHTVLDDLQLETNNLLGKLRPGLQVQFLIQKNKSNGELDETLDINYIIEGINREFRQLSGAQKLIVSLCLKLGLLSIVRKRLDVDIKLLLLDEVDQALDEAGVDMFADTIKSLQTDYKILVISHNSALKEKFSHALVVNQDDDLTSTTKLVEKW